MKFSLGSVVRIIFRFSFGVFALVGSSFDRAHAYELNEPYRSPRVMGMGGGYTALADDGDSLFLNPAGLARVESPRFTLAQVDLGVSTDIIYPYLVDGTSPVTDISIDTAGDLIGTNIWTGTRIVASYVMPRVGVGLIAGGDLSMRSSNKVLPQFVYQQETITGVQGAVGIPLYRGRRNSSELSVGAGFKFMIKRGGYRPIPLLDLLKINQERLLDLAGGFGSGIGGDMGVHYGQKIDSKLSVQAGLAFINIGGLGFSSGQPDSIAGNLTFGLATKYKLRDAEYTLLYDFRQITTAADWRKKHHFGLELKWPLLSVQVGLNQVYPTYGLALRFFGFTIGAVSYAEAIDSFVEQRSERRWLLRAAFGL